MGADKEILKLVPTMHSAALLRRVTKKKRKPINNAFDTIVGTSFIKAEKDLIDLY